MAVIRGKWYLGPTTSEILRTLLIMPPFHVKNQTIIEGKSGHLWYHAHSTDNVPPNTDCFIHSIPGLYCNQNLVASASSMTLQPTNYIISAIQQCIGLLLTIYIDNIEEIMIHITSNGGPRLYEVNRNKHSRPCNRIIAAILESLVSYTICVLPILNRWSLLIQNKVGSISMRLNTWKTQDLSHCTMDYSHTWHECGHFSPLPYNEM